MEKQRLLKIFVGLILLLGAGFFGVWEIKSREKTFPTISVQSQKANPTSVESPPSGIFYPINNYPARLKVRDYGKFVQPGDEEQLTCGREFNGFHVGDDLETEPSEANFDVPVYSLTQGKVLQISTVGGYGGLLVAQYNLSGQDVTVYYGHLDLSGATVKAGDSLVAGEKIGSLGKGCSSQTDGERKHLHFAIHKGTTTDIRGYVKGEQELSRWLDPITFLQGLGATEPTR